MKTFAVLLLCCLPALAKDHITETAKVIFQNVESQQGGVAMMPMGTGIVGVPLSRRTNVIVVETSDQRMTWQELGNGRNVIILPVHGNVDFYRDGSEFIVLDGKKKKHKFTVTHIEAIK